MSFALKQTAFLPRTLPFCLQIGTYNSSPQSRRHVSSTPRNKSYYDILEITPSATANEVKAAYYKLSKQFRPDVNQSSDAAPRFREISEAYETLGNVRARQSYDVSLQHGGLRGDYGQYGRTTTRAPPSSRGNMRWQDVDTDAFNDRYEAFKQRMGARERKAPPTGKTKYYDFDEFYRQHYQDMRQGPARDRMWEQMRQEQFRQANGVPPPGQDFAFRTTPVWNRRFFNFTVFWLILYMSLYMITMFMFSVLQPMTDAERIRIERQRQLAWQMEHGRMGTGPRRNLWYDQMGVRVREGYPDFSPPPIVARGPVNYTPESEREEPVVVTIPVV